LKHRRLHCTVTAFPAEDASRVFKIGEFGQQGGRTISIVSLMIG